MTERLRPLPSHAARLVSGAPREPGTPAGLVDSLQGLRLCEAWKIVPGTGIGPLNLGVPGPGAADLLRRASTACREGGGALYVIHHAVGWTAVAGLTSATVDRATLPDPTHLTFICAIRTTCPAHRTAAGVRAGMSVPEMVHRLGPPEGIARSRVGTCYLYPAAGMLAGAKGGAVVWLSVIHHMSVAPMGARAQRVLACHYG